MLKPTSQRAGAFTESVIREMTRLCEVYGAINLAQGFPDFDPPAAMRKAATIAINHGLNQYSSTHGSPKLRKAIVEKMRTYNHVPCNPEDNVTVTCGTTEGMISSLLAILDPGEEVVILEPFYENYGPDSILSGARRRYVGLAEPSFTIEEESLKDAFSRKTKAIIVNTPHNPTGRVFTRQELELVRDLCLDYDAYAITDEIYEHITYDDRKHVSIASLDGMSNHTITISGFSKTYSATGWRVGYVVAPKKITAEIRKVHDFLTVCAPTPLQAACVTALGMPRSYYENLRKLYDSSRNLLMDALEEAGFSCTRPEGAYYIWTDIRKTGFKNDRQLARYMISRVGVGGVPGSSFYHRSAQGRLKLRFSFSKKPDTIRRAALRLKQLGRSSRRG